MSNKMTYLLMVLVIKAIILMACSNKDPIIKGRYISAPNVNLEDVKIAINLIDKESENYHYRFYLKKDGSFSVRVKERGRYMVSFYVNLFPPEEWRHPVLSNEISPFTLLVYLKDDTVINLENIFISDRMKITSPERNKTYNSSDEIVIGWEKVPLADFYNLTISRVDEEDKSPGGIHSQAIRSNQIAYNEIKDLKLVKKLDFDGVMKTVKPFNIYFNKLTSGKYLIHVSALKALRKEKKYVYVSETSNTDNYYFYIK